MPGRFVLAPSLNTRASLVAQQALMPRQTRFCTAGYPVRIIRWGNHRQAILTFYADLAASAHWQLEGAERSKVSVHSCESYQFVIAYGRAMLRAWLASNGLSVAQALARCQ